MQEKNMIQSASQFIRPRWIGETIHAHTQQPSGIHLFGLVVDPAGYLVAGIFGARPSRMANFMPEIQLGIPQEVRIGAKIVCFKPAAPGSYERFTFDDPERFGRLVLYIDRTALMTHTVETFEDQVRFFATGSAETEEPFFDLWSRRMQNLLSVAILPEWRTRLWEEMVSLAWIAPCENYGGFGHIWDVFLNAKEAIDLLLELVKKKQLR